MQNLNNDKAIDSLKYDSLGMASFAKHVADILKHTCNSQTDSFVFGLYGNWGDGKTSFVNLVKECLGKAKVNQEVKNIKRFCIFDIFIDGFIRIPLFLFVLFFSFEDFFLRYNFFVDLLGSTYNINYNIFFLFFFSLILKITLLILIIKVPKLSLQTIFSNNKYKKIEADKDIQIIDFSPWNMIDEKTLLENFFSTIKKSLTQNTCNDEINKQITKYINAIIRKCSNGIIDFDIFKEKDISSIKEDLTKVLENSNTKIIVFIDDIDRLEDKEVCLIFKLVKSIANLPNISYFLSFDKNIVAIALNKHHEGNGEKYLEKIIQVPFSLPNIRNYKLEEILKSEIQKVIDENPEINEEWEEKYKNAWEYAIFYKFFNFLKNPRSIKRYINLVKINYNSSLKKEINIVDFFLITILQLEHTELYNFVKDNKTFFTHIYPYPMSNENLQEQEKYKNELDKILEQYNLNQRKLLIEMLCFLFPTMKTIYKNIIVTRLESTTNIRLNGRICSSENFDKFFWFDCDENDISLSEMQEYIELTNNVELFSAKLLELNERKKLKIFLSKFEEYIENNISFSNIKNIIKAFFNKGDYFDNTYDGFLSLNVHAYIYRIIIELLNLKITNQIEILEECTSDNESIFPMVQLIGFLADSIKDDKQHKQKYVNEENIKPLINNVLDNVYTLAKNDIYNINDKTKAFDGHIINHPMIRNILWFWYHNGNKDELRNYVKEMTNTNEKLLIFLDNISSVSHVSNSYNSWIEKKLKKDELEMYFDINELETRLIEIENEELSDNYKDVKNRGLEGIKNINQF